MTVAVRPSLQSSTTMSSKVSFTVRRPTPISRESSDTPDPLQGSLNKPSNLPPHIRNDSTPRLGSPLARSSVSTPAAAEDDEDDRIPYQKDSSDEDSAVEDELVTGFDKFGVQRLNGAKKVEKPLVIPALKNKDWRELARKRRGANSYVPPSAAAVTGADGSVGGLGTKDTINSGPVLSGLQVKTRTSVTQDDDETMKVEQEEDVKMEVVEETEDQRALRAILAESSGEVQHDGPVIDIIPAPISETDALRQDVDELPEAATLEDYARVPVSQFGAALLRGMGWKEGTAATRKPGKGLVEPYLPAARPALLGIGAKEQEVYDDGSKKKNNSSKRPERRYMPVVKQERGGSGGSGHASPAPTPSGGSSRGDRRDRSGSPRRSAAPSRRSSPDRYKERGGGDGRSSRQAYDDGRDRDMDRRRTEDRDRRRNDDDRDKRRRDDGRDKERDRRDRDRDYKDRSDRRKESSSEYDSSRRRRD
ncbi:hypothetical protein D9619_001831 [Psilocybe cf. subviscida]|uniref:G-patch domain-containing protein n=1 Tax=Psilocybe cf. subviscida TaxID=2480587 RepID=A0A8H5BFE0_9AGAR|nr:hypothetical protein D9619_001831 [Psilocybe cf. subviscida]